MAKSDEELARELQAQFDREQAEADAADEEMAKRVQGEMDLEQQFEDANRRFHAEQDEKVAAKFQKEADYPGGLPKPREGPNPAQSSGSFTELNEKTNS